MDVLYTPKNFLEELLVVLVIYKMEINESPAFHSLTRALQSVHQTSSIFVYDNSPVNHSGVHHENWEITYRHDPANPGVSKAYNEGFQIAKTKNKKWLLLADQDTVFANDFFVKCKASMEDNKNENIFVPVMTDVRGIVSPFHFQFGRGIRLKKIGAGRYQLSKKKFINSGMLLTCHLFEISKGYDERFELDFSDLIFIERLKLVAQTFFVVDSTCTHALFAAARNSLPENLARFHTYCLAADRFSKQTGNLWVVLWKHIRAIAFSCRYFNWRFMIFAFSRR